MLRIDSHLHVWRAAEGQTPSVSTLVPPQTDVPWEAAEAVLRENDVERAVLVQPVFRGEDNSYVAACARAQPKRLAAVCVVDPRVAGAEDRLEHWFGQGCRGLRLRPRLPEEEVVFGHRSTFPLWRAAERLGVVISLLCSLEHAPAIGALAERFPRVPIVIDHLAYPDPTAGAGDSRFQKLLDLDRYPNVRVKLSGYHHFTNEEFPMEGCRDLISAIYDRFGPLRLLWGSDYPHVTVTCGYKESWIVPMVARERWTYDDLNALLGANARWLYWPDETWFEEPLKTV